MGDRVKDECMLFSHKIQCVFHMECVASRVIISTFKNGFNKIRVCMHLDVRTLSSENESHSLD